MTATKKTNFNKQIVALFSGQDSVVTTPKLYIMLTGNHSLAIVLNQCVYWSNKSTNDDEWFYKEYREWFDEIHMPERTLRRRFDRLEKMGWITTKVKKVRGVNKKHIRPHMDKIIDSISIMMDESCPDRPKCPDKENGSNYEQKSCTKVAPTGHFGRSRPAKMADSSIDTEDYIQKKTTNYKKTSSSFIFSETLDRDIQSHKLARDSRSAEEFILAVKEHVDNHSDKRFHYLQRVQGAIKLLKKLKADDVIFYVTGQCPKESQEREQSLQKKNQEALSLEYRVYISQFINDRDVLKLPGVHDKDPLPFSEWIKKMAQLSRKNNRQ